MRTQRRRANDPRANRLRRSGRLLRRRLDCTRSYGGGGDHFENESMKRSCVIPSRADGEGPLSCKLRYALKREAAIAVARSRAVCAARDDRRFLPFVTFHP